MPRQAPCVCESVCTQVNCVYEAWHIYIDFYIFTTLFWSAFQATWLLCEYACMCTEVPFTRLQNHIVPVYSSILSRMVRTVILLMFREKFQLCTGFFDIIALYARYAIEIQHNKSKNLQRVLEIAREYQCWNEIDGMRCAAKQTDYMNPGCRFSYNDRGSWAAKIATTDSHYMWMCMHTYIHTNIFRTARFKSI